MPNPDYEDDKDSGGCIIIIFILLATLYYGYHLITQSPVESPCPYRDSGGEWVDDC